jgi:hypothetical protein
MISQVGTRSARRAALVAAGTIAASGDGYALAVRAQCLVPAGFARISITVALAAAAAVILVILATYLRNGDRHALAARLMIATAILAVGLGPSAVTEGNAVLTAACLGVCTTILLTYASAPRGAASRRLVAVTASNATAFTQDARIATSAHSA